MQRPNDAIFVTGADAGFARCLYQQLRGVARIGWHTGARWIVFDMGMTPAQVADLQARFGWAEWRRLPLEDLPPHYVPSSGSYAFKPHILREVMAEAGGPVIWSDSANLPLGAPDAMLDHVRRHGFYILRGQASLQERCDPSILERIGTPRWTWGMRECVACFLGFDAGNPQMRALIDSWADWATHEDVLCPPNSIPRHMNDQAVLNALLAGPVCKGEIVLPERDVDISSGNPARFLSTRNKVKPGLPHWCDPLARLYWRVYKVADQAAHRRAARARARTPAAATRITVQTRDGGQYEVPLPAGTPWSHPVLAPGHVLLREGAGSVAVSLPDGNAQPVPLAGLAAVFHHEGRICAVTEPQGRGDVTLWRCDDFPGKWRQWKTVVNNVSCRGSSVFGHDGRWWLITAMESPFSDGSYRYLALFHTDDPVNGTWQAHPVNADGPGITARDGVGETVGAVFHWQGRLLRCARAPGGGITPYAMTLTPDRFTQSTLPPPPRLEAACGAGAIRVAVSDELVVWEHAI